MKFRFCRQTLLALLLSSLLAAPVFAAPVDLSLSDSISLALKNNPAMKIAQTNKEKSEWTLKQARSGKGISLDLSRTDMRSDAPPSGALSLAALPPYNYSTTALTATLPLYTGGKLENTIDQAKLGLQIADFNINATQQQLKLSTTTAYFGVLEARNLLEIAKQSVADFTAHLHNVQDFYKEGTVALSDVLQTKVRLANAEDGLVKAQNAYNLAVYNLNNIIGLPLHTDVQLKEDLQYVQEPLNQDECLAYALAHRPEMAAAQATINISKDQIKVAKSDRLPTVALSGSTGWANFNNFPNMDNNTWSLGLSAQFNIFDSGRTDALISQAHSATTIAQEQARQIRDNISLEVSGAYLSMKEAAKRIDTNKVAVEQAETDFKLDKERYGAGVGTNLDVIDAELALAQARTNYIQALYDYNTDKAQLDKAMGIAVSE
jgi:TolC family type I secretion outer membrane protein